MDYKILKVSQNNMCNAGIDNTTGLYFLCVPSGFADVPAYYPITTAEYLHFENMDGQTLIDITNRCLQAISDNKYKLQWASAFNPLYAIAQKANDDLWHYEIPDAHKSQSSFYTWDELILAAYTDVADIQKSNRKKN